MEKELLFDRDLSWLSFNERVLYETLYDDLGIYDKIKFVGIHVSNLDEFARVRLAGLEDIVADETIEEHAEYEKILQSARREVFRQSITSRKIIDEIILPELKARGIHLIYGEHKFNPKH